MPSMIWNRLFRLLVLLMVPFLSSCLQGSGAGGGSGTDLSEVTTAAVQPGVLSPKGDPEQVLGIKLIGWRFRVMPDGPVVDPDVPLDFEVPAEGTFQLPLLVEIAYTRDEYDQPAWYGYFRGPRIRLIFVPTGETAPTAYLYTDRTVVGMQPEGYNALFLHLTFGEGKLLVYYNGSWRYSGEPELTSRFQSDEIYKRFVSDPLTYYLGALQLHPKE